HQGGMAALGFGEAFGDVGGENGLNLTAKGKFQDNGIGRVLVGIGRGRQSKRGDAEGREKAKFCECAWRKANVAPMRARLRCLGRSMLRPYNIFEMELRPTARAHTCGG